MRRRSSGRATARGPGPWALAGAWCLVVTVALGVGGMTGALVSCTGSAPGAATPASTVPMLGQDPVPPRRTQVGRYTVALTTEPSPPALGELFQLHVRVLDKDGAPVEFADVRLNARMPQHDHGMETRPRVRPGMCDAAPDAADTDNSPDPGREADPDAAVPAKPERCRHPDGVYVADGFKFHMSGDWTVLVEVEGGPGPDSAAVVVRMP